jgi:transcriptional regulator with XRE-family HTH domain
MNVKDLRDKGGWTVQVFCQLLGVQPNTVYRWEREPERTKKMEALQRSLLVLIDQNPISLEQGEHIEAAIRTRGGLAGIYELLKICKEHQRLRDQPHLHS